MGIYLLKNRIFKQKYTLIMRPLEVPINAAYISFVFPMTKVVGISLGLIIEYFNWSDISMGLVIAMADRNSEIS